MSVYRSPHSQALVVPVQFVYHINVRVYVCATFSFNYLNCNTIVASGAMLQESEGVWAHIQHSAIRDLDKALSGN